MDSHKLLNTMAKQGLSSTTKDQMITLACAFWHEAFVPDVDFFLASSQEEQRTAGYLIEFFSIFNCLNEEETESLLSVTQALKNKLQPNFKASNLDDIAQEWGMEESIMPFMDELLSYQTRHYRHNTYKSDD